MAKTVKKNANTFQRIPFKMHPRVFNALGAGLVTSDVVAIIELVKNSYDAMAQNVWISFRCDDEGNDYLEIADDGEGMTREIIENVWCLVATPYKEINHVARARGRTRNVSGAKGLGRLSAARLGGRLQMYTKAKNAPCIELEVNWSDLADGDNLAECHANCRIFDGESPFETTGTLLCIYDLKERWNSASITDLEDNLGRLVSPFSGGGDFNIALLRPGESEAARVSIEAPEFLSSPKYRIKGSVDKQGNVTASYEFNPIKRGKAREAEIAHSWERIYDDIHSRNNSPNYVFSQEKAHCGPFSFEIRAWDISSYDTEEIADSFGVQKSKKRSAIRAHKGVSVYRDNVLVLPKSENSRDWLGLDLRRISKVGTRMSTSQLVGYVSVSAKTNPKIEDTSDRERLVSCLEEAEFEEILTSIVALLEAERDLDRIKADREKPMESLFESLSASNVIDEVVALSKEQAEVSEIVPFIRSFSNVLDTAKKEIQERFVHYSRLATVGTIAAMLVHEIRNRTTALGCFLDFVQSRYAPFTDDVQKEFRFATQAIESLERLADTFSPLASRQFRRYRRQCIFEEQINNCLSLNQRELEKKSITSSTPKSKTALAVDPGEMDAILLNLLSNAIYWLSEKEKTEREIDFDIAPDEMKSRAVINVHDSGPGIPADVGEKIFWPGVTKRPGGIGMGLTVVKEIIAAYGGNISVQTPGKLGGASFRFDLPLKP